MLLQGTGATFTASRIIDDLMQNKRLGENCQIDITYFLPGFHAGDKWQALGDVLLPRCCPYEPMPCEVGACDHACHVPVKMFGHQIVHIKRGAFMRDIKIDTHSARVLIQVPSMHVVDEKAGEMPCVGVDQVDV